MQTMFLSHVGVNRQPFGETLQKLYKKKIKVFNNRILLVRYVSNVEHKNQ